MNDAADRPRASSSTASFVRWRARRRRRRLPRPTVRAAGAGRRHRSRRPSVRRPRRRPRRRRPPPPRRRRPRPPIADADARRPARSRFANWTATWTSTKRHERSSRPSTSSPGEVRDQGQLQRGRSTTTRRSSRRSGRPLRRGPADTGWDLIVADRLDGRQAGPPRLGRDDRPRQRCRTSWPTSATIYKDALVGPEQRLPRPVAVGHDRPRLRRRRRPAT